MMTYRTLEEVERITDRQTADDIASDYVAVEREHVRRVRDAIDECAKEKTCDG
jgi:hypothetical protein